MRGACVVCSITLWMGACAAGTGHPGSTPATAAAQSPGSPDDRDDDGILQPHDRCPGEPETYNGHEDDDGCPDTRPRATAPGTGPEIDERILFERGRADIPPTAGPALDRIATRLRELPEVYPVVALEGHASQNEERTMPLSLSRASAVREALVERGIDAARLVARASGAAMPVCRRAHERCLTQNRRVDLAILPSPAAPVPDPEPPSERPASAAEDREGAEREDEPPPPAVAPPLERLIFAKGSATLGPKALPVLDLLAGFLKANPSTLEIEGHAGPDERSPTDLARARAAAVRAYLLACGVNSGSLVVRSFGAGAPACVQKAPACKALNRRVELRLP